MTYPIITVAGGSCSGKTTFVEGFKNAIVISTDSFYKDISKLVPDAQGKYDFESPDSVDLAACRKAAETLATGHDVAIPQYDYVSAKRIGETVVKAPSDPSQIIVVEGIFGLHETLRDLGVVRIYIEAPAEIRVARRIKRDVAKGRSVVDTLEWFVRVEAGHQKYIEPTKKYANLIIPFSYSPIVFSQ